MKMAIWSQVLICGFSSGCIRRMGTSMSFERRQDPLHSSISD